jgi:hypothetical protein
MTKILSKVKAIAAAEVGLRFDDVGRPVKIREAESNDLTGVLIGFSASRTTCFVLCGNRQMKVDSTKVELVFEVQQIRERQLDVNSLRGRRAKVRGAKLICGFTR